MNRPRIQILMMLLTILGVTGFQVFWLMQTYEREKSSLKLKTESAFKEVILDFQSKRMDSIFKNLSALPKGTRAIFHSRSGSADMVSSDSNTHNQNITVRVIRNNKRNDSSGITRNNEFFISNTGTSVQAFDLDSGDFAKPVPGEMIMVASGFDAVHPSPAADEVNRQVKEKLNDKHAEIQFKINGPLKLHNEQTASTGDSIVFAEHPAVYKMEGGNNFPYLIRQIKLPIIFSLLLTTITILSFIFLYRNLQKQRRLTEMKNEFIGNITHELKTPIATVSVALEALNDFDGLKNPERTKEYLGIAGGELNRLSMMVDKVLRLSMFENKSVTLQYERFDLAELIREVMQSMQPQLEKAGAETSFKLTGSDFNINADKMHISGVLYNLLDNAVKYSKDNPQISITATEEEKNITVRIKDNGIGIDPAYLEKIFEKFFRVPHGDMHNVKGYGLGLSYTAHIIKQHNGSIRAESDGTNGTTFIIQLPRHAG